MKYLDTLNEFVYNKILHCLPKYKIQIEKGKEDDKVRDVHTTEINSYLLIKASLKMGLWLTWSN